MPISQILTSSLASNLVAPSATTATTATTATALSTASGSAPSYSARAWVNFNGTGTVAIRASGNVSSITDNSAADYTVNFTTAMPDANYAVTASCEYAGGASAAVTPFAEYGGTYTSTQVRIVMRATDYGFYDRTIVGVAIFR